MLLRQSTLNNKQKNYKETNEIGELSDEQSCSSIDLSMEEKNDYAEKCKGKNKKVNSNLHFQNFLLLPQ